MSRLKTAIVVCVSVSSWLVLTRKDVQDKEVDEIRRVFISDSEAEVAVDPKKGKAEGNGSLEDPLKSLKGSVGKAKRFVIYEGQTALYQEEYDSIRIRAAAGAFGVVELTLVDDRQPDDKPPTADPVYFDSMNGDDEAGSGSEDAPFKTLQDKVPYYGVAIVRTGEYSLQTGSYRKVKLEMENDVVLHLWNDHADDSTRHEQEAEQDGTHSEDGIEREHERIKLDHHENQPSTTDDREINEEHHTEDDSTTDQASKECRTMTGYTWKGTQANSDSRIVGAACKQPVLPVFQEICQRPRKQRFFEFVKGAFIEDKKNVTQCTDTTKPLCSMSAVKEALESVNRRSTGMFTLKTSKEKGKRVVVDGCVLKDYRPWEVKKLIEGKKIVLSGDSLMRQFFRKFTMFMRGQMWKRNFEHKAHVSEYYAANSTHDFHKFGFPTGNPIKGGFEVFFLWQPLPETFGFEPIANRGPFDLHFFTVGNWWKGTLGDDYMDGWAKQVNSFAEDQLAKGLPYHGVYMTGSAAPWKPGMEKRDFAGEGQAKTRIARVSSFLTAKNIDVVSFRGFSQLPYFPRTDRSHYMCGTREFYPKWMSAGSLSFIEELHKNTKHRCYDFFNANFWVLMFNGLFNKPLEK